LAVTAPVSHVRLEGAGVVECGDSASLGCGAVLLEPGSLRLPTLLFKHRVAERDCASRP
jgi:hypothetical protein